MTLTSMAYLIIWISIQIMMGCRIVLKLEEQMRRLILMAMASQTSLIGIVTTMG